MNRPKLHPPDNTTGAIIENHRTPQPIRALQLITGLAIGAQAGGAEQFAAQLACNFDRAAIESTVCCLWRYGAERERIWEERLRDAGIAVHYLMTPSGNLASDLLGGTRTLWSIVQRYQPHIINSHSERTDFLNLLVRMLHPLHPHAVRTMHTDQQWQDRPWLGKLLIDGVFPLMFQAEVAISETVRHRLDRRILARLLHRRSVLCYNGIDAKLLEERPEAITAPYSATKTDLLPGNPPRIGIVARLTQQKNHADLIAAMRIVCQHYPAHLLIIGSGPLEPVLRQQTDQLELSAAVHFLGNRDDVFILLPQLDLLVLSSLWEGFPTVLLEAMAFGVPVVTTDVSGSRELVINWETGLLVQPHEPTHLARAITTLLGDPEQARKMAKTARQHIAAFTIQNTAVHYTRLYQNLVGRSRLHNR